ncbi:1-deoxy-D-xylulose-5-phosphate synthase [Treponema endosymbiont of Eucomonympha sp.]|uniref:1-deoxy-D-xylulose-5-phosphate synthase n=1 Tax=Treponema endosymbiont of Eucomonympha sp. TaxID=1580831 RepID=UPI001E30C926|nr:1-deoxy-D-xylulose-5-phosphate synthase [Treponema endosymbiont of Eucomonympha sp.]
MQAIIRSFYPLLENIHSPADIKTFSPRQLASLAKEIRGEIVSVVEKNGGHLASNLGVVELTIALHRVFESPEDAIVWDVSHQSYTHKLLTGRYAKFHTLRKKNGIAGFTKRKESPHDFFDCGHASTSISSALGLWTGRSLSHTAGKVVAVIGDGALTGGMAFEALSHAGQIAKNLIVVVNDNRMSINPNTGSFSRYLSRLTMTAHYQTFRSLVDQTIQRLPVFNRHLEKVMFRLKRGLKGLLFTNNLFSDLGFEYVGALNGHNIEELEKVFRRVQKLPRPVVVHVVTTKGMGYAPAERDPVAFHGVGPAIASAGGEKADRQTLSFTDAFSRALVRLASEDTRIVAITAAMAKGTGLTAFAERFPSRFFDVGIAEEHALAFAAGLAAGGMLPIAAVYSTFMQRAVDQVIHDVALASFPVVIAMDRAGAVPDDGETHQGIFDIALLSPVPNLIFVAPASASELDLLLSWAVKRNAPVALRYPKNACPAEHPSFLLPVEEGRGVLLTQAEFAPESGADNRRTRVLVVCTGGMFSETLDAAQKLLADFSVDIYNLRFIKPVDETYFLELAKRYTAVLFVEDGVKTGGIGRFLERLVQKYCPHVATQALGFPDRFIAQGKRDEILADADLSPKHIEATVRRIAPLHTV